MLSTSVLSFSNKLPLSPVVDEVNGEPEDLLLGYRSKESVDSCYPHHQQQPKSQQHRCNQRVPGRSRYRSHHHQYHHKQQRENSPLSSDSLGSSLTSVKVKYLGAIRATGRSAILNKGITAIQSELIDLYTIAQRKFVSTSSNQTTYQIIEICNYGVVIAEPDPSAATTLSVVGQSNVNPNRIVVTKVITPLSNIVLWAGVRFNCRPVKVRGRHRLGAAFIPLSCSTAVLKASSYTPLTTSRSRFLSSLSHPPLFLCVLRKVSSPKIFECHLFACCTIEDAINLSSNLSDVQNGILKVGNPSVPLQSDLPCYSYSTFDEVESRTSSRQLSSSTISADPRHVVGTESPSLLTDRTSRLTVNSEEPRFVGLIQSTRSSGLSSSSPRREMFNYRREIGLRPWPSSAGIKINSNTQHGLSSSSDLSRVIRQDKRSVSKSEQLSQHSSSQYSMCQACLSNGQLERQLNSNNSHQSERVTKRDHNMNYSNGLDNSTAVKPLTQSKPNQIETNNYNGYVVQFKYNESINQNNHRYKSTLQETIANNKQPIDPLTSPKVPNISEDENLSKLGRRGQRFVNTNNNNHRINGRSKMKNNCQSATSSHNKSNNCIINNDSDHSCHNHLNDFRHNERYSKSAYNGFNRIIEDDNLTDLTNDSAFLSSDLIDGDGLLTFVEDDLRDNSIYPPMVKVNPAINGHLHGGWPLGSSNNHNNHLTLYPNHYRSDIPSRLSSSNGLFRRLGRWKLRSWVRKSFNLKFRRKKKRNKVDLFADRDLRYLSLAEPLDYIGDRKLGLSNGNLPLNRLQLNGQSSNQTKGYFLGMETVNDNYSSTKVMGTQELPEERTGLENLKQLIEKRKNQTTCQVDALLVANGTSKGTKKGKPENGETNEDQHLSKIDLFNELGYLP
uniref:PID domain-containing protein n=1 Tax=Tetranychus urticae TaxID=32264 RepID=T1JVP0_TETUR